MPRPAGGAPQPVEVELEGKQYTGTYTVAGSVIRVSYGFASKSTQTGGMRPDDLAKMILGELVREELRK